MTKLNKKIKFKIAADGSSASGKTTGSKLIAKKFKMNFLSSGTLYRYCALKTLENKNNYNVKFINKIAKSITLNKLNNKKLYVPEVAKLSSIISKKPFVRQELKSFQKNFALIQDFGWTFELQVFSSQMKNASVFAKTFPKVKMMLQHCGMQ